MPAAKTKTALLLAALLAACCLPLAAHTGTAENSPLDLGPSVTGGYRAPPAGNLHNALRISPELRQTRIRSRCTAKLRDYESGLNLDYFGARYYAGAMGRFTSADKPFNDQFEADPQSWNLYSYTRNNPLKYVDQQGEWLETSWDVANVVWGVKSLVSNVRSGNYGSAALDAGGVVLGTAAVILPAVPGGAGALLKGGRAAGKVADVVTAGNKVDNAVDVARSADNAVDVTKPKNVLGDRELGEVGGPKPGSTGGRGSGKRFSKSERTETLAENEGNCVFCGSPATEADHAQPRSRGGDRNSENRQPTCTNCTRSKGAKTSEEFLRWNEEQNR